MKSFGDQIERALDICIGSLCLMLLTVLCIEVVNRYFFGISWPWVQYIVPFCFLWMCMLGSAVGVRRGQHFEVDLIANLLDGLPSRIHRTLMLTSTVAAGTLIAWSSIGFVQLGLLKSSPATGAPMIYIYASLLLGGVLMALFALERLITGHRKARKTPLDEVSL